MDEVDGNSRDASTDGSCCSISYTLPELQLLSSEAVPPLHSSWSSPQLPGDINYSPRLRRHNFSWSERTDVDRTNFSSGPAAASGGGNQFENSSRSTARQSEISCTSLPRQDEKSNTKESSFTHFHALGCGDPKLSTTEMPLCRESGAELQSEFSCHEDELVPRNNGLQSGAFQPQPEASASPTLELRSDLNPWHEKDLEQNKFLPNSQNELSLLSLMSDLQPARQMDFREHLPKSQFTALREANPEWNARMLEKSARQLSMTGSFVQQCSDTNDFESYGQFYRERYEAQGNILPREMRDGYNANFGAGHLERVIQTQDELLRSRDQEILELKEANHRQSLFIEKVLSEKRLLETAVVEQARLLMSHGVQRSNMEPVRQPVLSCGGSFDSQLYEAQLATYREDFENERKEKLLIKASADSLKEQLQMAFNELRLAQDKAKRTEEELERYKNPYRAAYQPYLQNFSRHPNSTASSSTSSAASAQSKTPLYRKPDQLEQDRVNQTILARPSQMNHLSHLATDHEEKVGLNESTRSDQPRWTEEAGLTRPSHAYQVNQSGTTKRPPGKENQINQNKMTDSGQLKQFEQMNFTRQGQFDWMNYSERPVLAY